MAEESDVQLPYAGLPLVKTIEVTELVQGTVVTRHAQVVGMADAEGRLLTVLDTETVSEFMREVKVIRLGMELWLERPLLDVDDVS